MRNILSIKDYLNEAALRSFDIHRLDSLNSFQEKILYCKEKLGPMFGEGTSRVVFEIDDETVLKLAKNKKGLAQNKVEEKMSKISDCVVKCFECSPDFKWLIEENSIPASKNDFEKVLNISFEDFCTIITYAYEIRFTPKSFDLPIDEADTAEMFINEFRKEDDNFIIKLIDIMIEYKLAMGDLLNINNYGMVNRDGETKIILLDSGLDFDVFYKHYNVYGLELEEK